MGYSQEMEAKEGLRARASSASPSRSLEAGRLASRVECGPEEGAQGRSSKSPQGPTATPSTSVASIEDPMVVELGKTNVMLPTPTDPIVCHASLPLTLFAISLRASGSDIGEHYVYP